MPPARTTRDLVALLALATAGCAAWHTVPRPYPAAFPARRPVEVWQSQRRTELHGVRVDDGVVIGVPSHLPLACDSCRIAIPLAQVDSLRLGDDARRGTRPLAIGLALFVVWRVVTH